MRVGLLLFCVLSLGCVGSVFAQSLDISSGGAPSITGALNGSVSGGVSVEDDLVVTINFGEVSPMNTNGIVKVVVPISIRSNQAYKVQALVSGASNTGAQALQRTDIGFGVNNLRIMGPNSRICTQSSHIFNSVFNNDPATTVSIGSNGRAVYLSDLNDIVVSSTIISGPRLSNGGASRKSNDGYVFDAILAITPQFFAPGTTTALITFTISAGPNVPC
jgi:hypothetical protein